MKYFITHIIRQSPNKHGWTQLPFITRKATKKKAVEYYLAYNEEFPLDSDMIEECVMSGVYKQLDPPILTERDKFLWISPEDHIWLANKTDPFSGEIEIVTENEDDFQRIKTTRTGKLRNRVLPESEIRLVAQKYGRLQHVVMRAGSVKFVKNSTKLRAKLISYLRKRLRTNRGKNNNLLPTGKRTSRL